MQRALSASTVAEIAYAGADLPLPYPESQFPTAIVRGRAGPGHPVDEPAVGAVLMSVSTIVVALNAQLLRRLDLRPAPR